MEFLRKPSSKATDAPESFIPIFQEDIFNECTELKTLLAKKKFEIEARPRKLSDIEGGFICSRISDANERRQHGFTSLP